MTRSSFTGILLGGTLAVACSKPNPLFLDTWGVVTDSGANSESGATSTVEPTTTTPPTTATASTDPPPTTTTEPSSDTASSITSEDTPGTVTSSTETTGDPVFCEFDENGCCTVRIEAEIDSFFSDAVAGVGPGCPLVADPGDYPELPCSKWSFGTADKLRIFNDEAGVWLDGVKGRSVLGMRFPMQDGKLVADGAVIPWAAVKSIALELAVEVDWANFGDFEFMVYGLSVDQEWFEGDGDAMAPCSMGGSSFACRECTADPNADCAQKWGAMSPLLNELVQVPAIVEDPALLALEISPPDHVAASPGGLVVLPLKATLNGQPSVVPSGALIAHARESDSPPALRVEACQP